MSRAGARTGRASAVVEAPGVGARGWGVLALLTVVYVLNFLDRQLLSILAKPIQDSLHVTDRQLGLIGGLYFALFYCLISLPVGWLADRTGRARVLAGACALWSAATAACGLATGYAQLVGARMLVGVGEAGGVPPSYAIIAERFPPARRGTAFGIFNLGPPIGQALGVAFGAAMAAAYGWRRPFLVLGLVGLVAAGVTALGVRDAAKGAEPQGDPLDRAAAGFARTVAAFFSRRSLVLAALGGGVTQIVTYGAGNFTTLLLMREKGMTLGQVAVWYAAVVAVGMGGGIFASGRLIDRFRGRGKSVYAWAPAVTLALAAPLFAAFTWAPRWPLATALLLGPTFFNYFYLSSAVALTQEEVRPDQRVLSGALLLLVMNLMGLGLGPTYVGWASDRFAASHPGHGLQTAFYTLLPVYGVAIALFLALARVLRAEDARERGRT